MSAGTLALTNNSATAVGTGTAFTTDLKVGDFIVVIVGGVTYTLGVKSIESATSLTLIQNYGGPTASSLAWTAVPNATLVGITSQVAADVAKAIRGLNLDKANWQAVYSSSGNITVILPDGSSFTGPSWNSIVAQIAANTTAISDNATAIGGKAAKGANSDITSLSGLTTALTPGQGGTGVTSDAALITKLRGYGFFNSADIPQAATPWLSLTLQNSWVYTTLGRYRKINGFVSLQFYMSNGLSTDGTVLFNLPTGYRPSSSIHIPVWAISKGVNVETPRIFINSTTGDVSCIGWQNNSGAAVSVLIDLGQ